MLAVGPRSVLRAFHVKTSLHIPTLPTFQTSVMHKPYLMPPLQLPHSGVTWSHQLDGDTIRKSGLAAQRTFKARESVSMYVDDGSKTMQVVEALRHK